MLTLAGQTLDFADHLPVGMVVINAVLPRTNGLHHGCTPEIFLQNANKYNDVISTVIQNNPSQVTMVYNKQRGIINNEHEQPRPVSEWSNDGIHLSNTEFKAKYKNRIRHTIMDNLFKIVSL